MTYICGLDGAPSAALRILSSLLSCCSGAALDGPTGCTCWTAEYNADQQEPDLTAEPTTRDAMCEDCAFRPGSPERSGDPRYSHSSPDQLAALPHFWCHQGMRKPVRFRHPLGIVIEADSDGYEPPRRIIEVNGERVPVPYRADGQPGQRCAGWAAHHAGQDPKPISAGSSVSCHVDPDEARPNEIGEALTDLARSARTEPGEPPRWQRVIIRNTCEATVTEEWRYRIPAGWTEAHVRDLLDEDGVTALDGHPDATLIDVDNVDVRDERERDLTSFRLEPESTLADA